MVTGVPPRVTRRRLAVVVLGKIVGHQHRAAVDRDGGVHQLAAGARNPAQLNRIECIDVEVDGRGGVGDGEIRGQVGGDWGILGGHGVLLGLDVRVTHTDCPRRRQSSSPLL
jgi:hypothetical protein